MGTLHCPACGMADLVDEGEDCLLLGEVNPVAWPPAVVAHRGINLTGIGHEGKAERDPWQSVT